MSDKKNSVEDSITNLEVSKKIEKLKACFTRYFPGYYFDFKLRLPTHPGDDFGLFEIYFKQKKNDKFKPVIFSIDNPNLNTPEIVIEFLRALDENYLSDLDRKGAIDPDRLILKQHHYESGKGKEFEEETMMQKNFITNSNNFLESPSPFTFSKGPQSTDKALDKEDKADKKTEHDLSNKPSTPSSKS